MPRIKSSQVMAERVVEYFEKWGLEAYCNVTDAYCYTLDRQELLDIVVHALDLRKSRDKVPDSVDWLLSEEED